MTILPPPTLIPDCLTHLLEKPADIPMMDSNDTQPSQESLEGTIDIDKTLQELGKWLQRAKFEPGKTEGTENCVEKIPPAAKPLFDALCFKVPSLI